MRTFVLDIAALRGKTFAQEGHDCAVLAMMVLLEVSYSAAHTIMHLNGRNNRIRWSRAFLDAIKAAGGKSLVKRGQTTIENFVDHHQHGRFLIWIDGHAFAVIDGLSFDYCEVRPKQKVLFAWQFPDSPL